MRDKRLDKLIDQMYLQLEIIDDPDMRKQVREELLCYLDMKHKKQCSKAYAIDKIIQIAGIIIPVMCWGVALDRQMFLETGEHLTRFNSTRNVINTPKINISKF